MRKNTEYDGDDNYSWYWYSDIYIVLNVTWTSVYVDVYSVSNSSWSFVDTSSSGSYGSYISKTSCPKTVTLKKCSKIYFGVNSSSSSIKVSNIWCE